MTSFTRLGIYTTAERSSTLRPSASKVSIPMAPLTVISPRRLSPRVPDQLFHVDIIYGNRRIQIEILDPIQLCLYAGVVLLILYTRIPFFASVFLHTKKSRQSTCTCRDLIRMFSCNQAFSVFFARNVTLYTTPHARTQSLHITYATPSTILMFSGSISSGPSPPRSKGTDCTRAQSQL